jgi:hypothetical protein
MDPKNSLKSYKTPCHSSSVQTKIFVFFDPLYYLAALESISIYMYRDRKTS